MRRVGEWAKRRKWTGNRQPTKRPLRPLRPLSPHRPIALSPFRHADTPIRRYADTPIRPFAESRSSQIENTNPILRWVSRGS
jgi:hypothetical protein